MPRNSLAPGFMKIFSTTTISSVPLDHVQTLGIAAPVWSGLTSTIQRKSGSTVVWTTALTELVTVLRKLVGSATTLTYAELWRQDAPTDDPLYVSTVAIALAGTGVTTTLLAGQMVIDFKGADDSDMRFTVLEPSSANNRRVPYTSMSTDEKAFCDYVIGSTTWLYTRGNSFPVTVGFLTSKVNDKLREQRLNL